MRWRAFLVLVLAVTFAAPARADDRGVLEAFLEDNLSSAGREVRVEGFRGALSSQASLDRLTIADGGGVWLTLEGVTLDWTRSALFSGALEVNALTAKRVVVARLPAGEESALPAPEASGFALPELPVSVSIGKLAAPDIVLGPEVLGTAMSGRLEASLSLSGGEGRAALLIERTDAGPAGRVALTAGYANSSSQLLIDLKAEEGAGGIAASLLGVPGRPATRLALAGSGPLSDFAAEVNLATDGVERLAGGLRLQAAANAATAFSADLAGDIAPLFLPDYAAFFGDALNLKARGTRAADGRLTVDSLSLNARAMELGGRLALAGDGLPEALALDLVLADPSGAPVLLPAYGEPLRVDSAKARISYDRAAGEGWTAAVSVKGFARPGLRIGEMTLDGSGRIGRPQAGRPVVGGTVRLSAQGLAPEDPALASALGERLAARAVMSWAEGSGLLRLGVVEASGDAFALAASGTVRGLSTGFRLAGSGEVTVPDLARFAGMAGRPLSGGLRAGVSGEGSPLGGDFDLAAEVAAQDLRLGQEETDRFLRGASAIRLSARRDAEGLLLRELSAKAGTGQVTAEGRIAGAGSDLSATLDLTDLAALGGAYRGAISARASFQGLPADGHLRLDGTATEIAIGQPSVDGLLRGTVNLDLAARLDPGGVVFDSARLEGPSARIAVTGRLGETRDLRIVAALPDLSVLGNGLRGGTQVEARVTGPAGSEELALEATGERLGTGIPEVDRLLSGTTALSGAFHRTPEGLSIRAARLSNPQLRLNATGTASGSGGDVAVEGRLGNLALLVPAFPGPLTLSGSLREGPSAFGVDLRILGPGQIAAKIAGDVSRDGQQAALAISGSAQAALANPFLGARVLSGGTRFDLRLSGPLALASLTGTVGLSGGRLSDPDLPFALSDIEAAANLSAGRAQVTARAVASGGGEVGVSGSVGLGQPRPADLSLTLTRLRLRDPSLYDTRIDGSLRITGPMDGGALVSGALALGETELRIPDSGVGGSATLPELRHRNEPGASRETRRKAGLLDPAGEGGGVSGGPVYGLDVEIKAPNRIFLRGRGLDMEMGGSLRLGGTTAAVAPEGAFQLVRGRLDLLGKRLTITEARLDLQGDLDPRLYAAAVTSVDGGEVAVIVEGPASAPEVAFRSSAGLPEEEVLARLLFGRGLDRISAFQAAQLASAVATLAGRGGDGIVGRLRKGFGLDDLDIQTDETGAATLKAGRYINDRVYSEVEIAPDGNSRINLNLDLKKGITAKGSLDSSGQSGIGLYIEKNY